MTTSKRLADRKVERFDKNIKKRGLVPETTSKKKDSYPVGPIFILIHILQSRAVLHGRKPQYFSSKALMETMLRPSPTAGLSAPMG
ncbi:hypothetical protein M8C21_015819 [Ambrosia artemisiifolia]|uniref:Uncharacterized protein n=1 Tax=Ambrosia artemisiifolia TaxID=4212 RepID=A0AAD5GE49_AMBAR|nr:hypothetical protein M8C21_015819 [Ambrosia artemisiifolia]